MSVASLLQLRFKPQDAPKGWWKLLYRLQKISRKLEKEAEVFDQTRLALVEATSEEPEEGKTRQVSKDKLPEFRAELEKVLEEEVDIDIQPIPAELFGDLDLAGQDWMNLLPLIEDIEKIEK